VGAFTRPLRRDVGSFRATWLATVGLIAPTSPSLPLTVIRRTARRPGWRMADRLILAALGLEAVGRPPAHRRAHRSHPQQAHAILRLTPACVVRRRRIIGPNLYRGPRSA
jgi:hypothetical protein